MKKNNSKSKNIYIEDYKELQKSAARDIFSYKELALIEDSINNYINHMSAIRANVVAWEPYDINKAPNEYGYHHIDIICENLRLARKKLYKVYELQHTEINEICQSRKQTGAANCARSCATNKAIYCYSR